MDNPHASYERRPRDYALEILRIESRAARVSALSRVPDHLRPTVEFYVRDWWGDRRRCATYVGADS